MDDKKKGKLIATLVSIVILVLAISMWIFPTAVHAYEGDGETYSGSQDITSSTQQGSRDNDSQVINPLPDNDQWNKVKREVEKLVIGVDPGKFNNAELPAWVKSLGNTMQRYEVYICNSLISLLLSFLGLKLIHGILAIVSDGWFQFFAKFKYSFFSKSLYKIKAEDGVVPESGNRNNGNNGMNNGYNTGYNTQNYNRNQQNNQMNGVQQGQGGQMQSAVKEKLSNPIMIGKYLLSELVLTVILILSMTLIKTGVLTTFIAYAPVWVIEVVQNFGSGMV